MAGTAVLLARGIFGKDAFGRKPVIPELAPIDAGKVQDQTIAENLAALPEAARLAAGATTANVENIKRAIELALPGQFGQVQNIINAQLRGEIPKDVAAAIQRSASSSSFSRGIQGSDLMRGLSLRNLGLTSIGQQQQGVAAFGSLSGMFAGGAVNPSSMFFSPQQRLDFALTERGQQFQRALLAAQVKASPDPFKSAMTQAMIQDENRAMELAGDLAVAFVESGGIQAMAACWVAREVFGTEDIRWRLFRLWMLNDSPGWFRALYLRYGEKFSKVVRKSKLLKRIIRKLMTPKVNLIADRYGIPH
jgi:hypothetical protein